LIHGFLLVELAQQRFDVVDALFVLGVTLTELVASQTQHRAQLIDAQSVVEHRADIVEGEAEILQHHESVQSGQLRCRVLAVSVDRVDTSR
jgi:hypothetical protein